MRNFNFAAGLFVMVVMLAQTMSASAVLVTIADYQDDFQGPTPATGWRYQTNSAGAIGNSANYTNMISNVGGTQYNLTGSATLPVGSSFASLNKLSGHPGTGTAQVAGVDRYVIAAYTIQAADVTGYLMDGPFQLTSTSISRAATDGGTLSLHVYVNNTLIGPAAVIAGTAVTSFNRTLGNLVVGDTVYVAVGPNGTHNNDSFGFDFSIQLDGHLPAPEPSTAMLLGAGMLGLSMVRRRGANGRGARKPQISERVER